MAPGSSPTSAAAIVLAAWKLVEPTIRTRHGLPELVRARFPRPVVWGMWLQTAS